MGFRGVNFEALAKFNSATSSQLIDTYKNHVLAKLQAKSVEPKTKTFAPSSLRCDRKSWFRLRGVDTDFLETPDMVLNFTADVGTARHIAIQTNLSEALGDDWVDIKYYLENLVDYPYEYELTQTGMEYLIELTDPPVRFACDGIIRLNGKLYLLEIKTSEYASWQSLTEPKSVHKDQITCYSALLQLPNVLVLYEDRQYGDMKCYEEYISPDKANAILKRFKDIQEMVEYNIAPNRLPDKDYMCSNCEYRKKCKDWG